MRLMKRILLGTACSLLFLMNHTEAQTMNNSTEALSPKERQIAAISAHTARATWTDSKPPWPRGWTPDSA